MIPLWGSVREKRSGEKQHGVETVVGARALNRKYSILLETKSTNTNKRRKQARYITE